MPKIRLQVGVNHNINNLVFLGCASRGAEITFDDSGTEHDSSIQDSELSTIDTAVADLLRKYASEEYYAELHELGVKRQAFSYLPLRKKLFHLAEESRKKLQHGKNEYRTRKLPLTPHAPDHLSLYIRPKGLLNPAEKKLRLRIWQGFALPLAKSIFHPTNYHQENGLIYRVRVNGKKEHTIQYNFPDIPPYIPKSTPERYWPSWRLEDVPEKLALQRINDIAMACYDGLVNIDFELERNENYIQKLLGEVTPRKFTRKTFFGPRPLKSVQPLKLTRIL